MSDTEMDALLALLTSPVMDSYILGMTMLSALRLNIRRKVIRSLLHHIVKVGHKGKEQFYHVGVYICTMEITSPSDGGDWYNFSFNIADIDVYGKWGYVKLTEVFVFKDGHCQRTFECYWSTVGQHKHHVHTIYSGKKLAEQFTKIMLP